MARNFLYCEDTDTKLYSNDIVTISSYPDTKFILKNGWYATGSSNKRGWYFLSLADKTTVIPIEQIDLTEVIKDGKPVSVEPRPEPAEEPVLQVPDYIEIPDSLVTLKGNDIVTISDYPSTSWVVKLGWYTIGTARKYGYYLIDISSRTVLPIEDVDLTHVSKEVEQGTSEYRPTLLDMDAEPAKVEFIVIPGTDIRLYDSDIVKLSNRPKTKWVVHLGWYIFDGVQNYGWYLVSINKGEILPVSLIDLTLCTLETLKTQGSELYDGKVVNYTRPFTLADAEVLNRTFITVETIAQRDNLDTSKLVNGRLVRVNNVGGVVNYYAWNVETQAWDKVDFSGGGSGEGIPEIIGTEAHPIVLSELEPGLYRVKGVYTISPTYETIITTPIDHIAFVSEDEEDEIQIKVITEDTITDYIVERVNVTFVNEYATHKYLENNYATINYVDAEIAALEDMISQIISELPGIIDERILDLMRPIPDSFIYGLFNQN